MTHLLNTLRQIACSESISPFEGVLRHSQWQLRRLLRRFPCELTISESHLYVDRPGGVAALVNAMGEYDFNNMRLLNLVLSRGESTFFDVGANIGAYTLVASESPDARVVAIEPHPATFSSLEQNVQRNGRRNVSCLNVALSNSDGDLTLADLPEPALNRVLDDASTNLKHVRVPGRRFDRLCHELHLYPDYVKIDVEGHERRVLEGFGGLLGAGKLIFIEGGTRDELQTMMHAAGFNGPWFCHFRQRLFSKRPQARAEDPVYLGRDFVTELRSMNFAIG